LKVRDLHRFDGQYAARNADRAMATTFELQADGFSPS
jgi:hypothetical protein